MRKRPFCHPHHSVTPQALTGGGKNPVPGEMSLASKGILFLDELPEFSRQAIEVMRQPLENHRVILSRVHGRYEFPADFMLVGAMNPCPCGYYPHDRCRCSRAQTDRYLSRVSGPILDRMDLCVEVPGVERRKLFCREKGESSAAIRRRVLAARAIQEKRFKSSLRFNGEMGVGEIEKYCVLERESERKLRHIAQTCGLSLRACHKILRTARTIADLAAAVQIEPSHVMEALAYRGLDRKMWGLR